MSMPETPLKCYIAGFVNNSIDSELDHRGFCRGLVVFAIPAYGVLFRCRAEGDMIDLEFGAFFSLLKFLQTKLKDEKIKNVQIASSNPEFIFAFTGKSRHLKPKSERMRLVKEYNRSLQLSVAFVKPIENKAFLSPADYPCWPDSKPISFRPITAKPAETRFEPFQRGIKL